MNYYDQHSFVSNSELGKLHSALYGGGIEMEPSRLAGIFDFGNLVDSAITEPHLLDHDEMRVRNEATGQYMYFTERDWKRGIDMAECALSDPVIKMMLDRADFQHAYYRRNFPFVWDRYIARLNARCKFDILNRYLRAAADIKTTASTNNEQFRHSIEQFRYYRQGAFYMDMARIDRFWFVGISKTRNRFGKFNIFHFAIKRGDEMYKRGLREYGRLGVMYDLLINEFNTSNITIKI